MFLIMFDHELTLIGGRVSIDRSFRGPRGSRYWHELLIARSIRGDAVWFPGPRILVEADTVVVRSGQIRLRTFDANH